jgi:hypothetical protein
MVETASAGGSFSNSCIFGKVGFAIAEAFALLPIRALAAIWVVLRQEPLALTSLPTPSEFHALSPQFTIDCMHARSGERSSSRGASKRIGQRVNAGSKVHDTIVATLTNGMANSGYVPTDGAFGRDTFQVYATSLKPGCAEPWIERGIGGIIEKMN